MTEDLRTIVVNTYWDAQASTWVALTKDEHTGFVTGKDALDRLNNEPPIRIPDLMTSPPPPSETLIRLFKTPSPWEK